MTSFVTGATGFLGSYALTELLRTTDDPVFAMVRATSDEHAVERLWHAMHMHVDRNEFHELIGRVVPVRGDLHAPGLGLVARERDRVLAEADAVLHIAASLNRKSSKACFNTNLRGTLSVVKLGMALAERGRLLRFTDVSTSAVAGQRDRQTVTEDEAIEWDRSDYDPYARTKKMAEHLCHELLDNDVLLTLRPSTVMGDSQHAACKITDMVVATCVMAQLPMLPLDPDVRLDFVAGDWVGTGIAKLHLDPERPHAIVHLTAGEAAPTGRSLDAALRTIGERLRFTPRLARPFHLGLRGLDRMPRSTAQKAGALMKVFWPYITNDVVFDNSRATQLLGPPPSFEALVPGMVRYAREHDLRDPEPPPL